MSKSVGGEGAIPEEVTADYELKETLGTGHFSKVKLGIQRKTGDKCAIKVSRGPAACKYRPRVGDLAPIRMIWAPISPSPPSPASHDRVRSL